MDLNNIIEEIKQTKEQEELDRQALLTSLKERCVELVQSKVIHNYLDSLSSSEFSFDGHNESTKSAKVCLKHFFQDDLLNRRFGFLVEQFEDGKKFITLINEEEGSNYFSREKLFSFYYEESDSTCKFYKNDTKKEKLEKIIEKLESFQ